MILKHPKVKVVANALGTPPADVIADIQASGRLVGALCGSVKHALAHKAAGVDFVIAQGGEGGGHTGDVGSVVLWPQVIDAVAPLPMLAAGGIGDGRQMAAAIMLGAQGVWTGSLWLTVEEAEAPPAQQASLLKATSQDTVRSRAWTGKPCRMLRNDWTEAWEKAENPKPLGMPLQFMVTADAVARTHRYADKAQEVAFNPVGQVVGPDERGAAGARGDRHAGRAVSRRGGALPAASGLRSSSTQRTPPRSISATHTLQWVQRERAWASLPHAVHQIRVRDQGAAHRHEVEAFRHRALDVRRARRCRRAAPAACARRGALRAPSGRKNISSNGYSRITRRAEPGERELLQPRSSRRRSSRRAGGGRGTGRTACGW